MNERVAQQAHQGGALIGAKQFGQVNGGGIKTEKIAALRQPRGLLIACAGGVKLRLDGLASGEKVHYRRT